MWNSEEQGEPGVGYDGLIGEHIVDPEAQVQLDVAFRQALQQAMYYLTCFPEGGYPGIQVIHLVVKLFILDISYARWD